MGFTEAATREKHEGEHELHRLGGIAGVARELVRLREDCHRWQQWTETMVQTYREAFPLKCVDLTQDVPGPYRYEYKLDSGGPLAGWIVFGPMPGNSDEELAYFGARTEDHAKAVVAALNTVVFLEEARDGDTG